MVCAHCLKKDEDVLCQNCSHLIDEYLRVEKRLRKVKLLFQEAEKKFVDEFFRKIQIIKAYKEKLLYYYII